MREKVKKPGFLVRILQKAISSIVFPASGFSNYLLPRTSYDYEREVGDGMGSSVVMAPVFWIARRFAEAKVILNQNDEPVEKHDILDLLKRPNPFYSGRMLRMAAAVSYSLDGNIYFLKVRNRQLKPVELWYVPHWLMNPHSPESGTEYIDYYEYSPMGVPIKYDPADVIHIKFGIDPNNIRKGMAPLKSLFREIFTDDEAANFSASMLRNMGIPGLVISPGTDNAVVNPKDNEAVKEAFKKKFGRDRRGEPLVMSAKTDVKQFGFSPNEMDLSALREIPEERVTAILGVPAAVVGFGTGLQQTRVGATQKEMREAAYEDCIIPMQNLYADELNTQLLPDFEESPEQWAIDFDLSDIRVLQEDENAKAERIRGLVKDCLLTRKTGLEELGYESTPGDDVYLYPFNIMPTPAGSLPEQETTETVPGAEQITEDEKGVIRVETKSPNPRTRLLREFQRSFTRLTGIFERELKKVFNELGETAANIYLRTATGKASKQDAIDELYADLIVDGINPQALDYKRQYLRVAQDTFKTISDIMGLGVNLTDENETRILTHGGTRRGLIDLEQQTKDAVFKVLDEARAAGEGPYEIAFKLKEQVAAGPWTSSTIRAKVIARTETKNAQNVSSIEAYKSGGVTEVEIVDGQLPTSDEECIARNGKTIPIEEVENLDEHPNGTLSYIPVIGALTEE